MGKLINFGSLNMDWVYSVPHLVGPGETLACTGRSLFPGGKGLNQSLAAARAGATVFHVGCLGEDGACLLELLKKAGVDTRCVEQIPQPTGHTVIQVTPQGENAILVFQGANGCLSSQQIHTALDLGEPGDLVLAQNETNSVSSILKSAHRRGLTVAFNPSPVPQRPEELPLEVVDLFLLNRREAVCLSGEEGSPQQLLQALRRRYPKAAFVLTLGEKGSIYQDPFKEIFQPAYPTQAVDTTAAGDTFCGYFLQGLLSQSPLEEALDLASLAAGIAVSRPGAAPSIPERWEVLQLLGDRS